MTEIATLNHQMRELRAQAEATKWKPESSDEAWGRLVERDDEIWKQVVTIEDAIMAGTARTADEALAQLIVIHDFLRDDIPNERMRLGVLVPALASAIRALGGKQQPNGYFTPNALRLVALTD